VSLESEQCETPWGGGVGWTQKKTREENKRVEDVFSSSGGITYQFPAAVTQLHTTLAKVNGDDFTHVAREKVYLKEREKVREKSEGKTKHKEGNAFLMMKNYRCVCVIL
jgi:hypothetical protein